MNRFSKQVSLVLISSSLILCGCEESIPEKIPLNAERPVVHPGGPAERDVRMADGTLKAEKEENTQNPGNPGSSTGSSHISHGGIYHSMPVIYAGRSGLVRSSNTRSSSSVKGVSSASGGKSSISSSSSRGGFGSSARGASSS